MGDIKVGWGFTPAPVTYGEFALFVRRGDYCVRGHWFDPPDPAELRADRLLRRIGYCSSVRNDPVRGVSWFEAHAYCKSRGGRLPWIMILSTSEQDL